MTDGNRPERASNKGRNWLIGCGAGCAALVLIGLALTGSCYALLRSATNRFDAAVETHQALDTRFGAPGDFTPWPTGAVPAERMGVFLAVREASQPARDRLVHAIRRLPIEADRTNELESKPKGEQLRSVLSILRTAMGLPGAIGDFFEARNRAMLDLGMGLGEYRYIYYVAYRERDGTADDELLGMLQRQLAALPSNPAPEPAAWREQLAAEIAALSSDPHREPWQDGLPATIAASIEPYRARLDASGDPATHPFELGRTERRGRFSYKVD